MKKDWKLGSSQVPAYRKCWTRKLSLALRNRSKGARWRDSHWPPSPVTSDRSHSLDREDAD